MPPFLFHNRVNIIPVASLALFQNHATDRHAIEHQRLCLAAFPGRQIGDNRHDVGYRFAVTQYAHGLARFHEVEIGLGVVAHFGEGGLFHDDP